MKNMKKTFLMILALMTALCLSIAAFAEDTAEPVEAPAAESAAVDEAQAAADALNEALTAYSAAKAESRKQEQLDSLKQELDSYVTAGKLTSEQADLILKYYTEQMTLQQDGRGFGRGGKGGRGGMGGGRNGAGGFGGGKGGRSGKFGSQSAPEAPDTPAQEPAGL